MGHHRGACPPYITSVRGWAAMEDRADGDSLPLLAGAGASGALAEVVLGSGPIGTFAGGLVPVIVQAAHRLVGRQQILHVEDTLAAAGLLDVGLGIFEEPREDQHERVELLARVLEASARATFPAKTR